MKETPRHQKAFDFYYSLGDERRSLRQVARKYNVTLTAVNNWNKAFNWQARVAQRDIENSKRLEKKTNDTIVNTKASYREDIKKILAINKALINTAIENGKLIISIKDVGDFKTASDIQEKLTKVDLVLIGEATERTEHKFTDVDLSKLSIEDKLKLKELISRAQNALPEPGSD
jgi:hypothetical protein